VTTTERRRFRGDGGSVIVEAAFIMPILLVIVLGLMDFSVWEFQESQASSAARDGARVGVLLSLDAADQSATKTAISDAVRAKIPDSGKLKSFNVRVWCAGGTPGTEFSGCLPSKPGQTRLIVEASWTYVPVSFVGERFGTPKVTSTAEMIWTGPRRPGGSATPPDLCQLNGTPAVGPKPNLSANPGTLQTPNYVEVRFQLNSTAFCGTQSATFTDSNGNSAGTASVTSFSGTALATVRAQTPSPIAAGSYTVELTAGGRSFSQTFTLDAAAPTLCTVSFSFTSGSPNAINGGNLQANINGAATLSNCAGTWSVRLVRAADNTVFQVMADQTSSASLNISFDKQKNQNQISAPKDFTAGIYRVEVSGGNLLGTASTDITVAP
jgi:hypothetical protein